MCSNATHIYLRIRKVVEENADIDVDDSYLLPVQEEQEAGLVILPLQKPTALLSEWKRLTKATAKSLAVQIP